MSMGPSCLIETGWGSGHSLGRDQSLLVCKTAKGVRVACIAPRQKKEHEGFIWGIAAAINTPVEFQGLPWSIRTGGTHDKGGVRFRLARADRLNIDQRMITLLCL